MESSQPYNNRSSAVVYCLKCGSTTGGAHYSNCPNLQTLVPVNMPALGTASFLLAQSAVPFDLACMKVRELEATAREAAEQLRNLAADIKTSHTVGAQEEWPPSEFEAKEEHDYLLNLADRLAPSGSREPVMPMMLY